MFVANLQNAEYTTGQIKDLALKLDRCEAQVRSILNVSDLVCHRKDDRLAKVDMDSSKMTIEVVHGLMAQVLKAVLFK